MKTKTINLQGKEYAQVKDRLHEFRTENPNGLIETAPTIMEDGHIMFKTRILKNKSDPNSAEATGHAIGDSKGVKAFEKLETISVGRALALLGYATSGEIASSEEMEAFRAQQEEKRKEIVLDWEDKLQAVTNLEGLKRVWAEMPVDAKEALKDKKDEMKAILATEEKEVKPKRERTKVVANTAEGTIPA